MPITVPTTTAATGVTLGELRQEYKDRGYDYLSDTRALRHINWSYTELCEAYPWPFLERTVEGQAPMDICDVRQILSVENGTRLGPLSWCDRRTIAESVADIRAAGSPCYWFFENVTLWTYPLNADTITVRYIRVQPELSTDDEKTLVPRRYADLIVDGAVLRGMKDDDNYEEYGALRAVYDKAVLEMANTLMLRHYDGTDSIVVTQSHEGG